MVAKKMTLKQTCYGVTVWLLLGLAKPSLEAELKLQSRDSIREVAQAFMLQKVDSSDYSKFDVEAGQLDSRLRLIACDKPLQAFLPPGARSLGNTTVGIHCTGTNPWTLYVPVKVSVFSQTLVTARPLERGTIITATDLINKTQNLAELQHGFLTDPSQAIGKYLKRSLPANAPLAASMLSLPRIIHRGDQVTLLKQTQSIQIRAAAKAMADGRMGETIRVLNNSSKQIVEGIVVSSGLVKIK
jgi:flagella basal body P-ring formation protein FlgA